MTGVPRTLPSGATTATARWPALTSTATTGCLPQVLQRRGGGGRGLPAGVQVPAARCRVEADVVADRAGGGLGGHLVPAVGELDRARQPVPAVRPVRQGASGAGSLSSSQPSSGLPPDRLIAPRLVLLPVGGQEQPGRLPLCPPLRLGQPGGGQVAPLAQQALPPRTTGTAPASSRRSTRASRAFSACSRMALACRSAGVAYPRTRPASRPPGRRAAPRSGGPAPAGWPCSARRFRSARLHWSSLVRVIAPAHRDDDSAVSARFRAAPGHRPALRVQPPLRAPGRQVTAGQRPQVRPGRPQHRRIRRRHPQPGPDPRPRRGSRPRTARRSPAARSPGSNVRDSTFYN